MRAVTLGVALVAGGVYAGHKWLTKASRYIDDSPSKAGNALRIKEAEMEETYTKEIKRIREQLYTLDGEKADMIFENHEGWQADPAKLEELLVRIEGIDKKLGESLRARLIKQPRIDAETLENFARRVEKSDEVFARRLRLEKFIPRAIKSNDLYHFGNIYHNITQLFNREVREKLIRVAKNDPSLTVKEVTNTEKVILAMRIRKATTFSHVAKLRQYEMEKEMLLQLSEGRTSLADMEKNLQKLMATDSLDVENHLKRVDNLFYRQDVSYENISLFSNDNIYEAKKLLANINEEEALLGQPLPTIEKIHKIAAHREAIRKYKGEGFELKSSLSKIDDGMSDAYIRLYFSEIHGMRDAMITKTEDFFWENIKKISFPNTGTLHSERMQYLKSERLESLKKEIEIFAANLKTNTANFEKEGVLKSQIEENEALKELLTEHRDNVVERLREAVNAIEEGDAARVQELQKMAEKERQAWSAAWQGAAGFGLLGGATVLATIDKSIWGHGEKQLGDYWSQIFSDKASFADATAVEDMPAVLNKLAEVLGYKVNTAALHL